MNDDELDDLLRAALQNDDWKPDLPTAQAEFQRRLAAQKAAAASGEEPDGGDALGTRRAARQARSAGRRPASLAGVAAAIAIAVPVALVFTDLPGQDSLRPDNGLAQGAAEQSSPGPGAMPGEPPALLAPVGPAPLLPAAPTASTARAPQQSARQPLAPQQPAPASPPPAPPLRPSPAGTIGVEDVRNLDSPEQVCGSGFRVVDQHRLERSVVYLLRNQRALSTCVVTLKGRDVGTATSTRATLRADGGARVSDSGGYRYYAKVTARTAGCVEWGGADSASSWSSGSGTHCLS